MFLVVTHLDSSPAQRLVNGCLHACCNRIGIHDNLSVHVAGSPSHHLRKGAVAAQETFFIRIQNCHQRDLRQVESFSQKIHAHQHIVHTTAQVVHNLHAVECGHITMDIVGFDGMV